MQVVLHNIPTVKTNQKGWTQNQFHKIGNVKPLNANVGDNATNNANQPIYLISLQSLKSVQTLHRGTKYFLSHLHSGFDKTSSFILPTIVLTSN